MEEESGIRAEVSFTVGHHQTEEDRKIAEAIRRIVTSRLERGGLPDGLYRVRIGKRVRPKRSASNQVISNTVVDGDCIRLRIKPGGSSTARQVSVRPPSGCAVNVLAVCFDGGSLQEIIPDLTLEYSPRSIQHRAVYDMVFCALGNARLRGKFKLSIMSNAPTSLTANLGRLVVVEPASDKDYIPAMADPRRSSRARAYSLCIFCPDPIVAYRELVASGSAVTGREVSDSQVEQGKGEQALTDTTLLFLAALMVRGSFPFVAEQEAKRVFDKMGADGQTRLPWEKVRGRALEVVDSDLGMLVAKDKQLKILATRHLLLNELGLSAAFPSCHHNLCERLKENRHSAQGVEPEIARADAELPALEAREAKLLTDLEDVRGRIRRLADEKGEASRRLYMYTAETRQAEAVLSGRGYGALVKALTSSD